MPTALVQLDNGQTRACRAWQTLGGSSVVQLVITSSPSAAAAAEAQALFQALMATFAHQGLRAERTPCGGDFGPRAEGCWASRHPGAVRRILVWVADAHGAPPVIDPAPVNGPSWTTVVPVLSEGTPVSALTGPAAHAVARWYRPGAIAALIPELLVAAGVSSDAFRIFISYRWDDAQDFAEQLFDRLAHARFDVYLDRFRTGAGENFVERIRAELADKACVVVLDTANVRASPWVAQEYAFARLYHLGLMAIDLPGGAISFPRIGTRLDLRRAAAGPRGKLGDPELQAAKDFVVSHYAAEVSRRYRHQRRLILSAAAIAGSAVKPRPDGMTMVGAAPYLVAASARPPQLGIVRAACEAASAAGARKAVVVGPLSAPTHAARHDLAWLARASRSVVVDERRLLKAMWQMQAGQL